jgi:hypothetical protein
MRMLLHLLLCGLFATSANAQQIVYLEDFEGGLGAWTATGMWNLESSSDPCGSTFGPFPSGTNIAWFGQSPACNFEQPTVSAGTLTLDNWIDLPNVESLSLRYWASSETEYCAGGGSPYDLHWVIIHIENVGQIVANYCQATKFLSYADLPWHERRVDLSAQRGMRIRVEFRFNSIDMGYNDGRGWLIDDVRVLAEPGIRFCPQQEFHLQQVCPCHWFFVPAAGGCRNSVDKQSTLHSDGSPSVLADTLRLHAVELPAQTTALLTQGTAATEAVFGDGVRCIAGTQIRMGAQTAVNGVVTWPAAGDVSLSVRGQVLAAGTTRFYSVIYRDHGSFCSGELFNLTDGQSITWVP